jgi:hypothetical protein
MGKAKRACKSIVVHRIFSSRITIFVGKWNLLLVDKIHFRRGKTFATDVN